MALRGRKVIHIIQNCPAHLFGGRSHGYTQPYTLPQAIKKLATGSLAETNGLRGADQGRIEELVTNWRESPLSRWNHRQHMQDGRSHGKQRIWLRRARQFAGVSLILLGLVLLFWLRGALYNHFVRFSREEAAWQTLRTQRQLVADNAGWNEYRGILHSHSKYSHDSEVAFEDILRALKGAGLDFICLSDHPIAGRADFSLQWRGLHDGKLFIPGFEMKEGIMLFGVASDIVLSNQTDSATLARQISKNGGLLFYAHPEEPRDWDRPKLVGMEIYNIHTDFKRSSGKPSALVPDLLLNQGRYPEHVLRMMFSRPVDFLHHWDDLNRTRHITGIAGNDCHQNVGFRGVYTPASTIRVEDTSPKTLKELKLNWFTRPLARLLFGPLQPDRKLFHIQLDPYERMARYVNTHVLARELSEPAILDALRAGRVFVGFDMIADSSSFRWFAAAGTNQTVMGELVPFSTGTRLRAMSPLPCRFTVLKDGSAVYQQGGRAADWMPPGPGKYRVEAELKVLGEWVP